MEEIEAVVRKFHLRQIEMRKLDGDITIACYISGKFVDSTRITTIDLKNLSETLCQMNKPKKMFACSIISTADRSEKIVCITCDPNWHLYGNVSRLFSMPFSDCDECDSRHVKSIEDAIREGFAENRLDVIVKAQEEAFDDEGATCFMDLVFCNDTDRIIFDLDKCITSVSCCLNHLNLNLVHFELHDLQGNWNHMRICLAVDKIITKSNIFTKGPEVMPELKIKQSQRNNGLGQFFLYVLLSFTITAVVGSVSQSFRERILQVFF